MYVEVRGGWTKTKGPRDSQAKTSLSWRPPEKTRKRVKRERRAPLGGQTQVSPMYQGGQRIGDRRQSGQNIHPSFSARPRQAKESEEENHIVSQSNECASTRRMDERRGNKKRQQSKSSYLGYSNSCLKKVSNNPRLWPTPFPGQS